jgi:predicted metalloprotease with PDZ domain
LPKAGSILGDFFSRNVSGTEELPCGELLARAGLTLKPAGHTRADFGFVQVRGPDSIAVVAEVEPGSQAEKAGVREGDVLVEMNGSAFPGNPERWLREHRAGELVRLQVRRGETQREVSFALGQRQQSGYEIEEESQPTAKALRIREVLLRGVTD